MNIFNPNNKYFRITLFIGIAIISWVRFDFIYDGAEFYLRIIYYIIAMIIIFFIINSREFLIAYKNRLNKIKRSEKIDKSFKGRFLALKGFYAKPKK